MPYEDVNRSSEDASYFDLDVGDVRERIHGIQEDLSRADQRLRAFTQERPLAAVGVAIAAGFLLGRALGRS